MAAFDWLDSRRRAMLRDMGIRVWHAPPVAAPSPPVVLSEASALVQKALPQAENSPNAAHSSPQFAPELVAARAGISGVAGTFGLKKEASSAMAESAPTAPAQTLLPSWALGPLQTVQAPFALAGNAPVSNAPRLTSTSSNADPMSPAPRWLVICEMPAADANPLADGGDAGLLLRNLLHAMHQGLQRLQAQASPAQDLTAGTAPVVQLAAWAPVQQPAPLPPLSPHQQVAQAVANFQPDVVLLLMGRPAAIALLSAAQIPPPRADFSTLPFNQLRGQPYPVYGAVALLTYDLAVLLRTPMRKAQAWEDVCLALQIGQQAAAVRGAKALQNS